jgi:hypothetical protein
VTTTAVKPGLSATTASPYTPIAIINGTPVYAIQGGRSGGGVQFAVGSDDGDDPEFDEDDGDDEGDDLDDEPEERPASMRGKPKPKPKAPAADGNADTDDDWEPPTREAVRRMEEALHRANRDAARNRRAGKAMQRLNIEDLPTFLSERGIDPETGNPYGDDVVDPADLDEPDLDEPLEQERPPARRRTERPVSDRDIVRQVRAAETRAERRTMDRLTPILAQQAAESAMRAAGFDGDQDEMDLALRMIDSRQVDVEIDDDGFEVVGIDEQVELIREKMPRLFKQENKPTRRDRTAGDRTPPPPRRRTGAAAVDGGERGRRAAKPLTWAEQMAQRLDQR